MEYIEHRSGLKIPKSGLGTYRIEGELCEKVTSQALENGIELIDTASMYHNEVEIGKAIKSSSVNREDILITTKIWNDDMRSGNVEGAFNDSLQKLDLDYIDLYLVHWPVEGHWLDSYIKLMRLRDEGKIKYLGVSNFKQHHLETLFKETGEYPVMNQIELHPELQLPELREFCNENDVIVEAWRPLMNGNVDQLTELVEIGKKHRKSPYQVALRFLTQSNVVVIPKASSISRVKENIDIYDFELNNVEMDTIKFLNKDLRIGADPDNFDF